MEEVSVAEKFSAEMYSDEDGVVDWWGEWFAEHRRSQYDHVLSKQRFKGRSGGEAAEDDQT